MAVGSDVPFFLTGGRMLAEGTGNRLRSLPPIEPFWAVLVIPDLRIEAKTKTLYDLLQVSDFSDGSSVCSMALSAELPRGELRNSFSRPLYDLAPGIAGKATGAGVPGAIARGLSGAGPAHFVLMRDLRSAIGLIWTLSPDGRTRGFTGRIARPLAGPGPMVIMRNPNQR
jgi:4-diphosphocytidyl-2-C-methyl-D-erythritol kinase